MVETKNKYNITSINEEKIRTTTNTKVDRQSSKSFLKFSIIKNAVIAISTYIISHPVTEYFALRLQDIVGMEIYEALGRSAFTIYSIISNAIMAEPALLALGITGIALAGDLVYISIKKGKELIKEHKNSK